MKRITSVICMLLALVVMICSMPMAGAVSSSAPYTYENSFLVTLESEEIYGPYIEGQLKDLLDVETCYILGVDELVCQLIAMNGDVPVEEDIERVKAIDGVVYAGRNKFAWDYAEHESSITLSQSYVEIPVGGTATLDIAETNLLYWMRDYRAQCVRIQVYHEICSYEKFNTMMWDLKTQNNFEDLKWYALYEDDSQVEYGETFLTVNLSEGLENRDIESPIGQYVVDFDSRNELEVLQLVEKLAENPNVSSVRIVYEIGMRGMPPVENWNVEDEAVVTLTIQNNSSGFIGAPHTAILQGNQVGRTVVQVAYGHGNELCYATCTVNVVEANPETPTDVTPTDVPYGDVNGDTKVDAKDALMVLKYAVQKTDLTEAQKLVAEVDGNDGINAKDALEILKYAVEKIDTFPAQKVDNLPAVLYQFEYGAEGAPQQEDTTVILRSAREAQEFLVTLDEAGLTNEQVTALLRGRANDKYFKNYTLLVKYNHGINGGDSGHQTIASITKEGTTAKIDAVPNFTCDGAPDARYSAWVKIADLPNDKIEGCDTFVIS